MLLTTPSDIFYKSKKSTATSSGLLLLSTYVGIVPASSTDKISLFSFNLENADKLPLIFFVMLIYSMWDLWESWFSQSQEVRDFFINKISCIFMGLIGCFSISAYACTTNICCTLLLTAFLTVIWFILITPVTTWVQEYTKKNRRQRIDTTLDLLKKSSNWELTFNPNIPNGKKIIQFKDDGTIGSGNDNESSWRIAEGLLEIFKKDGSLQSRFRHIPGKNIFEHTNDSDTLSLRDQFITPK